MIKTLVKKQMTEIFRSYIINPKTNTLRSRGSSIGFIVLFVFIMVVMLGGTFGALAMTMCGVMISENMTWLYFAMFSVLALALGIFGSVFNTYSGLYLSKDNDLLLSMPIPASVIVVSRLLSVYLMGLMYSSVAIVPAVVVYFIVNGFSVMGLVGCLTLVLDLSVVVLVLSCALGWVVAKASQKVKNKSFVTVILSLVFIGIYYYAVYNAQNVINRIINNIEAYGENIRKYAYVFYALGRIGEGKVIPMIAVTLIVAAFALLTWKVILSSFFDIVATSKLTGKAKVKAVKGKQKSVFSALLLREFEHFKSSPTYMLNCGLGALLIPISAILILVKGNEVVSLFDEVLQSYESFGVLMVCVVMCMVATMNDTVAPSISLEGKTLWAVQSLPIDMKDVLFAKVGMQLILTVPALLACEICAAIALKMSALQCVATLIFPIVFSLFYALFGLMIGLKRPNLTWSSEITPIKQNISVLIVLFVGWGYAMLVAGGYLLCGLFLDVGNYILAVTVITAVPCVFIYRWIKKAGAAILAAL